MYQIWYFRSRQPLPKFVFKYIFYISMLTICSNQPCYCYKYHLWNNEYVEKYKYVCIGYVLVFLQIKKLLMHSCENMKQKDIKWFQSIEHVTIAHIWQLYLYKLQKKPKELPCTKFHINCSNPAHSQPAATKTNSFENYFAAKKEFLWSDYQAVPIRNISRM